MTTLEIWESLTPEQMRHITATQNAIAQAEDTSVGDWYMIFRKGCNITALDDIPDEVIKSDFLVEYEDVDEESKRLILINFDIIPPPLNPLLDSSNIK